jgi:hypothetical protein
LSLTNLSGPVSIKYLVPIKEVFLEKTKDGIFLPIIILLGDVVPSVGITWTTFPTSPIVASEYQNNVNKDLDMYTKWRLSQGIKIHITS